MTCGRSGRSLVLLTSAAFVVATVASGPAEANETLAASQVVSPCGSKVTKLRLKSTERFAANSRIKQYAAATDYPNGTTYDQSAKLVLSKFPSGIRPTVMNVPIGSRLTTGSMVKGQYPQAVAAVDGDFFVGPTIRGKRQEISRGPIVRDGHVIRADRHRKRVVGVDSHSKPFGGKLGLRGVVQVGAHPAVKVMGVNWEQVQRGGATIYTPDWLSSKATPRPAGAAEWVLDGSDTIVNVRKPSSRNLGAGVAHGTRVVAFANNQLTEASKGQVGDRVRVKIRQRTDTGVKLGSAIGRGAELVDRGVAAPLGCDAYSYSRAARPRTLVGWTSTGEWRSLTVPGKLYENCPPICLRTGGFALANVAALAARLGFAQAYELDGGGSTTLYTRSTTGKWSRRDLYGLNTKTGNYERPVTNGFAFVSP